jgi:2-polyprenyl-3-methyl-5-hydroxy-6-metoxy-1,4-benzoquinol methylase
MPDQIDGLLSGFLRERRIAAARPHIEGRVLDYGCGVGVLRDRVTVAEYTGVDLDADSIRIARQRHPGATFRTLDEFRGGGPYDTIVALAVIEHVPNPGRLLQDFASWLDPEGRIVLTTPNPALEWAHGAGARLRLFSRSAHAEHQSLMGRQALQRAAGEAGLDVLRYRRFLWGANQLMVLRRAR